jgi:hypothetical protein
MLALLALGLRPAPARAGPGWHARLARASAPAPGLAGGYHWLEEAGLGVPLAPALPEPGEATRLLAGGASGRAQLGLWALPEASIEPLVARWAEHEPRPGPPRNASFVARSGRVEASLVQILLSRGRAASVCLFTAGAWHFAASAVSSDAKDAQDELDLLLKRLVIAGAGSGQIVPLIGQGRYGVRLSGWRREGAGFERREGRHPVSLRLFTVARPDFASIDALLREVERGEPDLRRTDAATLTVLDRPVFSAQYFTPGHASRFLYFEFEQVYVVAVFHGSEAVLEPLRRLSQEFAAAVFKTGLEPEAPPAAGDFTQVARVRVVGYRAGERFHWGCLFDDARGEPVFWRRAVNWRMTLTAPGGRRIAEASGVAESSRQLNPLAGLFVTFVEPPAEDTAELTVEMAGRAWTATVSLAK